MYRLRYIMMMLIYPDIFNRQKIGEANVYTLGDIGKHRVVSTKLPMAGGQSRDALIATGGTTTRLLGTFQVKSTFYRIWK